MKFCVAVFLSFLYLYGVSCGPKKGPCPEGIWGNLTSTIGEVVLMNLKRDGPEDGTCEPGQDKWILSGKEFNLPPRCGCIDGQYKGASIAEKSGQRCPDFFMASLQETFQQYWNRLYDMFNAVAPADGWCPKKYIKWIIKGSHIGKEKDICGCLKDYKYYSQDVILIDACNGKSVSMASESKNEPVQLRGLGTISCMSCCQFCNGLISSK